MFWNISKRDNFEIFQKSVGCTRNFRVQEEIPKGEAQIHQPNHYRDACSGALISIADFHLKLHAYYYKKLELFLWSDLNARNWFDNLIFEYINVVCVCARQGATFLYSMVLQFPNPCRFFFLSSHDVGVIIRNRIWTTWLILMQMEYIKHG